MPVSICMRSLLLLGAFLLTESHEGHLDGERHGLFLHTSKGVHVHEEATPCGMEMPSVSDEIGNQIRIDALQTVTADGRYPGRRHLGMASCDQLCDQCIEIKTYLHMIGTDLGFGPVIPHPKSAMDLARENVTFVEPEDFSTEEDILVMFANNIKVVNRAFRGTPFRFKFMRKGTTRINHPEWSSASSDYKKEIGALSGNKDLRKLDCYVSETIRPAENGAVLGTATHPGTQNDGQGDGVYVRYDVLTGGGRWRNDLGYTLVHEISHWLGLLHTFQRLVTDEPCNPQEEIYGDFVEDTPIQSGPSNALVDDCQEYLGGAEPVLDTCPDSPGEDLMFNFVNYVGDEECLAQEGSFTCGQIERMNRHWLLFRDQVKSCANSSQDMELEVVVKLDSSHMQDNHFRLVDRQGSTVFDSEQDYLVAYLMTGNEFIYMDICVPRETDYELRITDNGGNGFSDGSIQVFTDRSLVHSITGDFGAEIIVQIDAQLLPTPAPSQSTMPSPSPTLSPSSMPTLRPSTSPTGSPSSLPSSHPSISSGPTYLPSSTPSVSMTPSEGPTAMPTTQSPTSSPTPMPTRLNIVDELSSIIKRGGESGTPSASVRKAPGFLCLVLAFLPLFQ